jgi:hypothetical protein
MCGRELQQRFQREPGFVEQPCAFEHFGAGRLGKTERVWTSGTDGVRLFKSDHGFLALGAELIVALWLG